MKRECFWTNHIKPSKGRSLSAEEIAEIDLSKVSYIITQIGKNDAEVGTYSNRFLRRMDRAQEGLCFQLHLLESGETEPESLERREFFARIPSRFIAAG